MAAAVAADDNASLHSSTVKLTPEWLSTVSEAARTNSPLMRAKGSAATAARANVDTIKVWEDPMIMFGGMLASEAMRADEGDIVYGFEQKLPIFGKPQAQRQIAEIAAAREETSADYRFQLLRREIATAAFQAALAGERVKVGERDLGWLQTLLSITEERHRSGNASQVELLRVQSEHHKRQEDLITDRRIQEQRYVTLSRLTGRPMESQWPDLQLPDPAAPVQFNRRLVDLARRFDPHGFLLQLQRKQADAQVEFTRRERWPDVFAGAEARQFSGRGDFQQGMIFLKLSLPLGNWGKYKKAIERDLAMAKSADHEIEEYERGLYEELHGLVTQIDAARRNALLYRDALIPRARQALSSIEAQWRSSAGPDLPLFQEILEARRILLDSQLQYASAVTAQFELLAELILCCGLGDLDALQMLQETTEDDS